MLAPLLEALFLLEDALAQERHHAAVNLEDGRYLRPFLHGLILVDHIVLAAMEVMMALRYGADAVLLPLRILPGAPYLHDDRFLLTHPPAPFYTLYIIIDQTVEPCQLKFYARKPPEA